MGVLLCLALFHGLLYVFLVPPWSHYDEPTHLEHGWWIANRLRLPQEGDVDRGMRRETAASMLEHGFYRDMETRPDLLPQPEPVSLGASEFGHPPLYYVLIALPLRLLRHTDITFQLYLGRLVSLVLYVSSIAIAYGLLGELVRPAHPLRWVVPGAMALLPSYADLMTAVNSDAGAVVALSFFLWGAVRAIVRGPSLVRVVWMIGSAILCVLTKNTAAVAVPLVPLALGLAWRHPSGRQISPWWTWSSLLAAGALVAALLLTWGDAALWFRFTPQRSPISKRARDAPVGKRALTLEFELAAIDGDGQDTMVLQFLPDEDVEALRGVTVTLSAWIWATQPAQVHTPALYDGVQHTVRAVDVDRTPALHVLTSTVDEDAGYVQVILRPAPQPGAHASAEEASTEGTSTEAITVYYDDVALVQGASSPANRVRNGSFERTWPYVRLGVDRVVERYTRRSPSKFLTSVLDWRRTRKVYKRAALVLFQSFWARFGWSHVTLAVGWYWALGAFTLFGVVGAVLGAIRLQDVRPLTRRAIWLLLAAGSLVWLNALLRIHPLAIQPAIPVARYAYPAITPSMLVLVAGWLNLAPRRYRPWVIRIVLVAFLAIDVASVWTLWLFHYRR